jgi:hypothetical protein
VARMVELVNWEHEGITYTWDGVFLSARKPGESASFNAPDPMLTECLRKVIAEPCANNAGPIEHQLALLAQGVFYGGGSDTRRGALLLSRAKEAIRRAAQRAPQAVALLCAAGCFQDAEALVSKLEVFSQSIETP